MKHFQLTDALMTGQRRIGLIAAGAASAALGFVVLVGWHTHTVTLIQVHPALVPMQYNTAIGFLLSGLMLLALANTLIRVEIVLASLVAALGTLTLAQYVFSVDFGIDSLLMDHYITVQTSHPGRMAPNTALAFLLTGIAVLFAEVFVRHGRALLYGIFGSIVLGLGITAALGYAMELESAYGWGRLSRMAAHTLVGFIVIGTGLFTFGWQAEKKDRVGIPRWLPIPFAIGVLTVTFVMWQALNPARGVVAVQTAHYLVLFFGTGLAVAIAFAVNRAIAERTGRKTLEIEISERIQAEGALRLSEEHFRNLFENAEISIWNEDFSEVYKALNQLRLDGVSNLRQYLKTNKNAALDMATMVKVTQVNQATLKLFGAKTEKEFIGSIDSVFGPDALDVFIDELNAIWGNEKTFRAETTQRTLSGEELTVIISMPIPDTKAGFSSIPVSMLDITESKLSEAKLRKSEARYSEIFNDSPIGIWEEDWSNAKRTLDELVACGISDLRRYFNDNPDKLIEIYNQDSTTIEVSQAVCDMYRAPDKQTLIDSTRAELESKDELEGYLSCLIAFMAGETSFEYQSRDLRFDDTPITTLNRLVIPANYHQDWSRVINAVLDITEYKRLEEQLLHAQRLEAVGQLTGGVAHDFNNLMAVMIGNAVLLEETVGEDEEAKRSIEAIKTAVERGASLTNRLLAFSRQTMLSPVMAEVAILIGGLLDMLHRTLGETIELKVEAASDLWPAMIDPHQFENALVNLAINARDAMPQGGTLLIKTANTTLDETYTEQHEEVVPGDYVEISVSDSGTGMPPEVLEKVFEPFFTTKEVGEGSGLGLSMVYGFAKQSEGHITIYSEVGHGTTVKLYLPRSEEDVAREGPKDATREIARGSERILVVEDDEHVREVPVRLLRKQGYEVVEAIDGKEAIQHLEDGQHFDLLFTDIVLPGGLSGIEITEKAKSLHSGIKVLLTSGYAESIIAEGINKDLGAALLSKPYPPAKLFEKVRDILDGEGD